MTFSLADISDSLLTWVVIYGPIIISLTLFLGAMGLPAPGTFLVIASGAFVRQEVLDLLPALGAALVGVTLGDSLSYSLGRFARGPILRRFGNAPAWQKAEKNFEKRGGAAIYLTRWLLTPIAIPTNLVAGSGGYAFSKFILYDTVGELTWLILFGGIGYAFSNQWEAMSQFISDFSGVLVGLALLGLGIFMAIRYQRNPKEDPAKILNPEPQILNPES